MLTILAAPVEKKRFHNCLQMCSTAGRLHDSGLFSVVSFSLYRLLLSHALRRPRTGLRAHVRAHRCNLFTWAQLTGSINEPSWRLPYIFSGLPAIWFMFGSRTHSAMALIISTIFKVAVARQRGEIHAEGVLTSARRCSSILHATWAETCLKRAAGDAGRLRREFI